MGKGYVNIFCFVCFMYSKLSFNVSSTFSNVLSISTILKFISIKFSLIMFFHSIYIHIYFFH